MKKSEDSARARRVARNKQLEPRLNGYSALGTAAIAVAGAASLATGSVADATPQNITGLSTSLNLPTNGFLSLNFDAGPFQGKLFGRRTHVGAYGSFLRGTVSIGVRSSSNGKVLDKQYFAKATNLPLGGAINGNFLNAGLLAYRGYGSTRSGAFFARGAGAATGYVGFKAFDNGNTYYGWLRVKVQNAADGLPAVISLVAKDGEPTIFGAFGLASDHVLAGETFATAIPEPASMASGLALFALGAAGVREHRRRRKLAA